MINISLRAAEVAARIVPGCWEGDLIDGGINRSSVGTLVERISRYVMLVKLDSNTAQDVLEGFKRRLKSIPESRRKTMTYDQVSEMALHETLSAQLKMDIYFCDPHNPCAARLQRKRQRPGPRVTAQGHGPQPGQPSTTHRLQPIAQPASAQDPQLPLPARSLLSTDRGFHQRCRASTLKPPSRSTGFGRGFAPIGGQGLPAGTSATGTVSSTPVTCRWWRDRIGARTTAKCPRP